MALKKRYQVTRSSLRSIITSILKSGLRSYALVSVL